MHIKYALDGYRQHFKKHSLEKQTMTEEQIKHMRDRFLGWKLPATFRPDDGIRYTPTQHGAATGTMPSGTNLFDAQEADAMVRHMLEGLPNEDALRWPIQPEGIALILTEAINIPEIAAKVAKAIQSGNY